MWKSDALAKDGKHYKVLVYLLPVLPLGLLLFDWYILYDQAYNAYILGFVILANLIFLHQESDLIRLLLAAKKTVKQVKISDATLHIYLFNDTKLQANSFLLNRSLPEDFLNNNIYYRLFPKDETSATIIIDDKEYYLTATLENFDEMYEQLEKLKKCLESE